MRDHRGTNNPNAVLTVRLVKEMLRLHEAGYGYGWLAEWFHVTKPCVQRVLTGRSWRTVTGISPPRKTHGARRRT